MSRSFAVTPEIVDYAVAHGTWDDPPGTDELRAETRALGPAAGMQVGADQGQLLTFLARMVDARRAVEVGTFTGYSAACLARGLAPGGRLLCCDINEDWAAIARRGWERVGLDDRIELRVAPAIDTLRSLPGEPHLDLAFIDADKTGYVDYWAELVPRVRPGGLLVADNVLWSGRVVDEAGDDAGLRGVQAFNDVVAADDRVEAVVLPAFDGLTLARRR